MNTRTTNARALRAILAELGATPPEARARVEAGRARRGADTPEVLATLAELLHASDILGKTAHDVLGHVPDPADYHAPADAPAPAAPPAPDADALLARLTFLREHIVSTIDVQGAEVWQRPAADGRPLQAYAEDLARTDRALLARLRDVTTT
jgi:hypothetical protein